ncbi:hypothetical protein KKA14_03505 [bacterium]|nr:hypothetical protein [bacterium]
MKDRTMYKVEIASDAGYDFHGIALARIQNGKVVKIGYLSQAFAKLMVQQGKLPAHVYDTVDMFWDDNFVQGNAESEYLYDDVYNAEIYSSWESLARLMEDGDKSIHVGLCTNQEFCYWPKE